MEFLKEIEITKRISERKHPNVVMMVGCVLMSEPPCLLTEFMPYGSLKDYLNHIRTEVKSFSLAKALTISTFLHFPFR